MCWAQSAAGGEYFTRVQHEARQLGYRITSQIADAFDLGVPQKRRRQFIIGVRGDLPGFFPSSLTPSNHLAQRRLVVQRPGQQRVAPAMNSSACSGVTTGPADEVSEPVIRCSAYQAHRSRINVSMLQGVRGGRPEGVDLGGVGAVELGETAQSSTSSSPSLRCERAVRGEADDRPAATRCTSSPGRKVSVPRVTR